MSERSERDPAAWEEDAMAGLLRLAGPRLDVPADRAARVRQSVHRHWQAGTRRRVVRRRLALALALSTAAALALIVRLALPARGAAPATGAIVAMIERVDETVRAPQNGTPITAARTLAPDTPLRAGEWVTTNAMARAALRLEDGTSIRLDTDSRARLLSTIVIELVEGALYVDTGRESTGLEVRTALGTARDIGTQFEVRLRPSSLRVRVRGGVVELQRGDRSIAARSGTELTVTDGDAVSRPILPFGPEWGWTVDLAPALEIDGRPLAAFLEELSREHGWTLHYADAALARDAFGIILHGSVSGLSPRQALAVALTTSGLDHRFKDGELIVSRAADRE